MPAFPIRKCNPKENSFILKAKKKKKIYKIPQDKPNKKYTRSAKKTLLKALSPPPNSK